MCEITWSDIINIVSFYMDNLESVQIRMEAWATVGGNIFLFVGSIVWNVVVVYYLWRYWGKRKTWEKVFLIIFTILFDIVVILAYPQGKDKFYYYACKRKPFVKEGIGIDTVLSYVYEYDYTCYRGRRGFYKGGGYVKYVYRVLGVDSVLKGEYKFEGSFLCDIDTGFYYVIVPRGKWDNSIILLERRIPWDTIRVWRELMRGEDVDTNELNKQ